MAHKRLGPLALAVVGVAVLLAGLAVWREMSSTPVCPPGWLCALYGPPHRLHPLRAEVLWAFGVACLVAAACWAASGPSRGQAATPSEA
jgi:hypothetical protein